MKLLCWLGIHKLVTAHEKDMFGYEYVWQPKVCKRCGKRVIK
jgi:hypothetical protein